MFVKVPPVTLTCSVTETPLCMRHLEPQNLTCKVHFVTHLDRHWCCAGLPAGRRRCCAQNPRIWRGYDQRWAAATQQGATLTPLDQSFVAPQFTRLLAPTIES